MTNQIYQATIYYRPEKPYGVGRTPDERMSYIVPGWRGEVISELEPGLMIYTGVCSSREKVKTELIENLKYHGLSGVLRIV